MEGMAASYRQHGQIDAPIEDVWAVVSDPQTHADWWPDVAEVRVAGDVGEGGEYGMVARPMRFLDALDSMWVADRLDYLREARFRCTLTGMYAHFKLTPAQDGTFVEVETGMVPTSLRWRLAGSVSRPYFKGWLRQAFDALPEAVEREGVEAGRETPGG